MWDIPDNLRNLSQEIEGGGALGYVFLAPKPETPIFVVFRDLETTQKKRGSSARRSGKTRSPCRTGEKIHKIFGFYKPFFLNACFFDTIPLVKRSRNARKIGVSGPPPKVAQIQNARNLGKRSLLGGFGDLDAFSRIRHFWYFRAFGKETKKVRSVPFRISMS